MINLVLFLEEPSAREMLKGLLPRLLPENMSFQCVVFEGKQDLEKQIGSKLKAWRAPNARFVVLRDKDSGDCYAIKQRLVKKCSEAGRPETLVRVACHELESWYLGDLAAVEKGLGLSKLATRQSEKKFKNPDNLADPVEELGHLTGYTYQKVSGSRSIGPHLDISKNNSTSFMAFISGIRKIVGHPTASVKRAGKPN